MPSDTWVGTSETMFPRGKGGFPGGSDGAESACHVGDLGLIPGLGRSPGEGNSYTIQYSGLENSMDRRAWRATVHGITKSRTRLSGFPFFNEASDKIKNPIPRSLWLWKKALVHSACQFPHLRKETLLSYPKVGPLITGTTANIKYYHESRNPKYNKAEHQFQIPFL